MTKAETMIFPKCKKLMPQKADSIGVSVNNQFPFYVVLLILLSFGSCKNVENKYPENKQNNCYEYKGAIQKIKVQLFSDIITMGPPSDYFYIDLELYNTGNDTIDLTFPSRDNSKALYIGDTVGFGVNVNKWKNGEFALGLSFPPNEIDYSTVWLTGKLPVVEMSIFAPSDTMITLFPDSSIKILTRPKYNLLVESLKDALTQYESFINDEFLIVVEGPCDSTSFIFFKSSDFSIELILDNELIDPTDSTKMNALTSYGRFFQKFQSELRSENENIEQNYNIENDFQIDNKDNKRANAR